MNCAELEILLCDYVDGTLAADQKSELETHLAQCAACAELARDVRAAVGFIERVPEVEPPPELLTRIVFELPAAHQARPKKSRGVRRLLHDWVQPVLQPRFAMGFAMTILSFSLLARFAGIRPRQLTLEDLRPANVWRAIDDGAYRAWQRTVKFYENLRLVYEIQTQLRDWTQSSQEARGRAEEQQRQGTAPAPGASNTQGAAPAQNTGKNQQTPGTQNDNPRK